MEEPRDLVETVERRRALPGGSAERFSGYGVMGLPFRSGPLLALRRFPASSVGPGYTAVWHREPQGRWTFYTTVEPWLACNRYFGRAISDTVVADIAIAWDTPRELRIVIGETTLDWRVRLASTRATRALNGIGGMLPDPLWHNRLVLSAMGIVAGSALRAGRIRLAGRAPNGQSFLVNPRLIWTIPESTAVLGGTNLGPLGSLPKQARLGDFWVPQRGILAIGVAHFEPSPRSRHLEVTQGTRSASNP